VGNYEQSIPFLYSFQPTPWFTSRFKYQKLETSFLFKNSLETSFLLKTRHTAKEVQGQLHRQNLALSIERGALSLDHPTNHLL
jgi:streptomycin 6-kinase